MPRFTCRNEPNERKKKCLSISNLITTCLQLRWDTRGKLREIAKLIRSYRIKLDTNTNIMRLDAEQQTQKSRCDRCQSVDLKDNKKQWIFIVFGRKIKKKNFEVVCVCRCLFAFVSLLVESYGFLAHFLSNRTFQLVNERNWQKTSRKWNGKTLNDGWNGKFTAKST